MCRFKNQDIEIILSMWINKGAFLVSTLFLFRYSKSILCLQNYHIKIGKIQQKRSHIVYPKS